MVCGVWKGVAFQLYMVGLVDPADVARARRMTSIRSSPDHLGARHGPDSGRLWRFAEKPVTLSHARSESQAHRLKEPNKGEDRLMPLLPASRTHVASCVVRQSQLAK